MFSTTCWSQATNFIARKKNLVWENVVISDQANIPELISKHPRLTVTSSNNSVYKGKGTLIKNTCPNTSPFMENEFSFDFEIEPGEGKYRVTVSNIVYSHAKSKNTTAAEKYFLEKGNLKQDTQSKTDLECLSLYFSRIFTMTMVYKNKM
ncbi:hypothetical protein HYN59_12390 [Flavobacterium album]|uniref:Uncharacterized protein n=1 Tax=Flavobacterium album TaxID=2175091 RepID=A0A2S1QZL1_9FLAO|nr:hypothetical protein HYN59_12390 [Flavobacterium album]